ncbi:MAG: DUF3781 domain-containing protein [Tenacibaculum sp.]
MVDYKSEIVKNICYTQLVYSRINKKLNLTLSNKEIELMILEIIKETDNANFNKKGKNIYITNKERDIRLTINFFTNRIITVDKLSKLKK